MIRGGIIKVDGRLHQAESKDAGVEIIIALRAATDRGDMMQTVDGFGAHDITEEKRGPSAIQKRWGHVGELAFTGFLRSPSPQTCLVVNIFVRSDISGRSFAGSGLVK